MQADWVGSVRAECFILADGAQEVGGKLFVLGGGWDTLFSKAYPMTYPQMSLAIKLVFPWGATAEPHELVVELVDDDGVSVLPDTPRLQVNIGRPPNADPGDDIAMPFTLTLGQLIIPKPARYSFLLKVDGTIVARTGFRASRLINND
jgi:hypothetical protein